MNWFVIVCAIVGAVAGFVIGYMRGGKERINAEAKKNKSDTEGGQGKK